MPLQCSSTPYTRTLTNNRDLMEIQVRPATHHDAAEACNVIRRSILECCYDDHRGDAVVLERWLRNKTSEWVSQLTLVPNADSFVATADEEIVGFGSALHSGEVTLCYVAPSMRFMGVGKALLATIEHQAIRTGVDALHLESTRTALAFYLRNGFVAEGPAVLAFGIEGQPMRKKLGFERLHV